MSELIRPNDFPRPKAGSREDRIFSRGVPESLTRRERFLRACHCRPVDCAPVWLMRQAGRSLPEYRKLKERYTFLELVRNPELAAEVTLQPMRRFGFDAAIIFSDILVVPEALGQGYRFSDETGLVMDFLISAEQDMARLELDGIEEKLSYVTEALRLTRQKLGEETALLGFAGSPWTLANFMLEGGGSREYTRGLELLRKETPLFERLCQKLTRAVADFLRAQIEAGVDAVQIFDSHGGLLKAEEYESGSGRWIREVIAALPRDLPVIVFSKGANQWAELARSGARVLGVDWTTPLGEVRKLVPGDIALQGNLDPELLRSAAPEDVAREATQVLRHMEGRNGHIFNLGHGVPPDAKLENIEAVVQTVRKASRASGLTVMK
jgi:uroporphyrinogen decarboxylase